jgi:hypothetical protein
MAQFSHDNPNHGQTALDFHREALIFSLNEYQSRIEYLATYLQGFEQEALSLRSAADIIKFVVERLQVLRLATPT